MLEALPSVPSFSEQQVHNLANIIHSVMQQYFAPQNPPPPTPPAPQNAQKEEDEQLLQQATVDDITESTTKHDSSMPDSKSTLSTIPHLYTARSSGDSAACLSNLACQHIIFLNTLLGYTLRLLASNNIYLAIMTQRAIQIRAASEVCSRGITI